jgi:hypothetical protein
VPNLSKGERHLLRTFLAFQFRRARLGGLRAGGVAARGARRADQPPVSGAHGPVAASRLPVALCSLFCAASARACSSKPSTAGFSETGVGCGRSVAQAESNNMSTNGTMWMDNLDI